MIKFLCISGAVIAITLTTAKAADNVSLKLACENNIKVEITLRQTDQTGWADISSPTGTKRASFIAGSSNNMGGDRLTFASKGITFDIDYSSSKAFFLTFPTNSGKARFSCSVM